MPDGTGIYHVRGGLRTDRFSGPLCLCFVCLWYLAFLVLRPGSRVGRFSLEAHGWLPGQPRTQGKGALARAECPVNTLMYFSKPPANAARPLAVMSSFKNISKCFYAPPIIESTIPRAGGHSTRIYKWMHRAHLLFFCSWPASKAALLRFNLNVFTKTRFAWEGRRRGVWWRPPPCPL